MRAPWTRLRRKAKSMTLDVSDRAASFSRSASFGTMKRRAKQSADAANEIHEHVEEIGPQKRSSSFFRFSSFSRNRSFVK